MKPFRKLIAFTAGMLAATSTCAQWDITTSAGLQHTVLTEYSPDGRQLVREHGWMPGIGLSAEYQRDAWRLGISGSTFRRSIAYDGHLQSGEPFASDTNTTQDRLAMEASYRLTETAALAGGIEWEKRNRRIAGNASAAGLDERSTSWRLLAGGQTRLARLANAAINANAMLVFAQAERLHVHFDRQLFDDVRFSTEPAIGLRAALTMVPTSLPQLSATLEFDWMKVRRSDEAPLQKNGINEGTVTQPEHRRRTVAAYLAYRF